MDATNAEGLREPREMDDIESRIAQLRSRLNASTLVEAMANNAELRAIARKVHAMTSESHNGSFETRR